MYACRTLSWSNVSARTSAYPKHQLWWTIWGSHLLIYTCKMQLIENSSAHNSRPQQSIEKPQLLHWWDNYTKLASIDIFSLLISIFIFIMLVEFFRWLCQMMSLLSPSGVSPTPQVDQLHTKATAIWRLSMLWKLLWRSLAQLVTLTHPSQSQLIKQRPVSVWSAVLE